MNLLIWLGFLFFVLAMVLLDLGVFHRKAHTIGIREALSWTLLWIAMALAFNVLVYFLYEHNAGDWARLETRQLTGGEAAVQFFTGYVLEKSLSIDNVFVMAMIFAYFGIPLSQQHRLLFWGILGAIVLRGVMIGLGATLIERFEWVIYVLGLLVLASAVKLMITREDSIEPDRNLVIRVVRWFYPVHHEAVGGRFFTRLDGRLAVTPMFLALVLIETTDVMFAVDSIPAVFAVTRDPFLVFTSNIFAILGLRSMYFVLAGFIDKFRYLKMSLVFVLAFVGVKMLLAHHVPIPNVASLACIAGILAVGVLASIVRTRRDATALAASRRYDPQRPGSPLVAPSAAGPHPPVE
ncbi:MAG: TerC family protein [Pirellulaceae bacterium]